MIKLIHLLGLSFATGLTFTFTVDQFVEPGQQAVLVHNAEAFALRYPQQTAHVVGTFTGKLRDSGENLKLTPLASLRYSDSDPWPITAEGDGYSLERVDQDPTSDANLPIHWRGSTQIGG